MQKATGWRGIVWGGAIAGACDITYAIVNNAVLGPSTAQRVLPPLGRRPWLFGPLYGALVYVLMNTVVVPLSAAHFTIPLRWSGALVHVFLVGTPIALAVKRSASLD